MILGVEYFNHRGVVAVHGNTITATEIIYPIRSRRQQYIPAMYFVELVHQYEHYVIEKNATKTPQNQQI